MLAYALVAGLAYLLGSVPVGFLLARARGIDIRAQGSGNIGATNVGRVLGKPLGILVFALDFLKGAVPVLLVLQGTAGSLFPEGASPAGPAVAAGLAAFLGHCFPLWLGFRGGKGVATGAGVVAMLVPLPALYGALAWLVAVSSWGYVSLASLLAAVALNLAHLALGGFREPTDPRSLFCLAAGILVFVRHASNIRRLCQGTENRLRNGRSLFGLSKVLHVLALALWLGSSVFFSLIAAPALFASFTAGGAQENERPEWFPLAPDFARATPELNGPLEQGSRAAGYAVSPLFDAFFPLQAVCALVALATALGWSGEGMDPLRRWRKRILSAAILTVAIGWPLEVWVSDLREPRNEATLAYLRAAPPEQAAALERMRAARGRFGMAHGISLLLNFGTLALVAGATCLAAFPPRRPEVLSGENARPAEAGQPNPA